VIKSGWWFQQIALMVEILDKSEDVFVKKWIKLGFFSCFTWPPKRIDVAAVIEIKCCSSSFVSLAIACIARLMIERTGSWFSVHA
jgi:hypothetical protein